MNACLSDINLLYGHSLKWCSTLVIKGVGFDALFVKGGGFDVEVILSGLSVVVSLGDEGIFFRVDLKNIFGEGVGFKFSLMEMV